MAQPAEALADGLYTITYGGPGPCQGRRLSYDRYGRSWPGRVFLGAAAAKNKVVWRVKSAGKGQITMYAINRAVRYRGNLAYPPRMCNSPRLIGISKAGAMRWRPVPMDTRKGIYRVHAVGREPAACGFGGMGRFGPVTAQPWARRCDSGLRMWPLLRNTTGVVWKFQRVAPTVVKSGAPPLPTSPPPTTGGDVCSSLPTVPRVFSGRRLASTLGGIRPCFSGPGPRIDTAAECCRRCTSQADCVSFMFIKNGLDCRSEKLSAPVGACYLMDSYTGSYEPQGPSAGLCVGAPGGAQQRPGVKFTFE